MGLQLILGSSGSGKTCFLYDEVIREAMRRPDERFLILVPEQFTMQTQKELVMRHPNGGILNIDVLSFQRLAYRVFEELGVERKKILEETGKNLFVRKVAQEKKGQLTVLGGNLKKMGCISEMKSMISELMQYDVSLPQLEQMEREAKNRPHLAYKLHDIRILYEGFRDSLKEKYITSEEVLEELCRLADQSKKLKDSTIVLDGFTGFTPIQQKLMRKLLVIAKKVSVTVTIDPAENFRKIRGPHELFYLSKKMIAGLEDAARESGAKMEEMVVLGKEENYRFRERPPLRFLEQNLFRYRRSVWEGEVSEISLHRSKNPAGEVEFAARTIYRMVREEKIRYRDIALIAGDLSGYQNEIERIFPIYEIPCFVDQTKKVLLNPLIEFIRAALDLVWQNYQYESVFRCLRTGLCALEREEIDRLENYVLALGIRGFSAWDGEWTKKTRIMEDEEVVICSQYKERMMEIFRPFTEQMKKEHRTARDYTIALYELLVSCDVQQKLGQMERKFEEEHRMDLAKEYAQIYRIVIELFEKIVELLGDEEMTLREYEEILEAGFEEAKVGIIPPGVDQVLAGDLERTRLRDVKVLFFLGMNDGWVPRNADDGGILTDQDREFLEEAKVELAPTQREKGYIQKFYLYLMMTKPSQRLYLSYCKSGSDGKAMNPSYFLSTLRRMFPALEVADEEKKGQEERAVVSPESGWDCLIHGLRKLRMGQESEEWKELYRFYYENCQEKTKELVDASFLEHRKETLGEEIAHSLYGEVLENSVTRLEQFSECAFAHFLLYGLHLSPREVYEFRPPDMGNVFHRAMEVFSQKLEQSEYNWRDLPGEKRDTMCDQCVEEVAEQYGAAILSSTARNQHLVARMKRIMKRTIQVLQEQIQAGEFVPTGYEISFSAVNDLDAVNLSLSEKEKMRLQGRIDRIDLCEEEDKVYVKVIDYKSGNTSFDLVAMYHGLQLQLVVYLDAAMEIEQRLHPDKEIVPAGIFYYHIKDPMLDKEEAQTPEQIWKNMKKKLRLNGLVNEDPDVVAKLDKQIEKESLVIPFGYNKDGSPSRFSSKATKEQFQDLSRFVNEKMKEIGRRILDGDIEVAPYERKGKMPCEYCEYLEVCGFDKKIPGSQTRRLTEYKPEEIWKKLEEE
ncbi:MAG: helicase-exonuclease AddAB subunit AddB [Lachnospiraceae bacterium]|nr:helicase-exonuclease AddAB subunit AddB [Robinsoniella sp.]MDY3766221.1 helicase-exonuclease AddAB subunit AddB [Lachnospiraceae bacterium]